MKGLRSTNHEACGGQSARHVDRSMKSCTRLSRQRGLKNRAAERSKCRAHPRSDALLRTRTVTSSQGGPRRGSSQGRVA